MLVDSHVYRPVILELEQECRATARDVNIFWINVNAEFVSPLNDIGPDDLRGFPIRYGESHFLVNKIVVLKSCKISGAVLGPCKENQNQGGQNENLPAAQTKHKAEL